MTTMEQLEKRAQIEADGPMTGAASYHGITVRWYPVCQRYAYFDENGPVTKRLALKLLKIQEE